MLKSRIGYWHCPAHLLFIFLTRGPGWGFDIQGTVRFELDKQPVMGAVVRFVGHRSGDLFETQTDANGSYVLSLPDMATAVLEPREGSGVYPTQLGLAFPNPFNPVVNTPFHLAEPGPVLLQIYDLLGQPVHPLVAQELSAGTYQMIWDGTDRQQRPVAAGVYLYQLVATGFTGSGKLTLMDGGSNRIDVSTWSPKTLKRSFDVEVSGVGIKTLRLANLQPLARPYAVDFTVAANRRQHPLGGNQFTVLLGVPGGKFSMGSKRYQDESPRHDVFLDGFFLQQLETTQAEYQRCVEAGACFEPAQGEACNWGHGDRADHPVNCISWHDASRYCTWAGLRLPTEAEWEKAARGTTGREYPWGDAPPGGAGNCERAVMMRAGKGLGCGHDGTGPVGTKVDGSSPYGMLDMAGNVWEWVEDDYDREFYAASPLQNPINRADSGHKVLRGNSWFYVDPDPDMRAANRYRMPPLRWYPYVGTRCASSNTELNGNPDPPLQLESEVVRFPDWRRRNRAVQQELGDLPMVKVDAGQQNEMMMIPAGNFRMGTDVGAGDERPERTVFVSTFEIDRFEVTVSDYEACVRDGSCTEPYSGPAAYRLQFEGDFTNWGKPERADHPVNAVTWFQANTYCRWADKRLPTEAEWEKAARGTEGQRYPWGNREPDCDWIVMDDGGDGCGQESTWPVGAKPQSASPYGVHDMSGNVWEWVADWWSHDYYVSGPTRNPLNTEPGTAELKVLRGGSLADQNPHIHLTTNRLAYGPKSRFDYTIGFRCARSASF